MNTQHITINEFGQVIQSDDVLFDTSPYQKHQSVFVPFPLVENIIAHITRTQHIETVTIPKVEAVLPSGRAGIFDYHFRLLSLTNTKLIQWVIEDHTARYQHERSLRQERQEDLISKEAGK